MVLTNDKFVQKFVNLRRTNLDVFGGGEMFESTFFGDGGGWRFFDFSSLTFFDPSFSDKRTKKWLHLSHFTNRVDARRDSFSSPSFHSIKTYRQDFRHEYIHPHISDTERSLFLNHHYYHYHHLNQNEMRDVFYRSLERQWAKCLRMNTSEHSSVFLYC